MVYTATYSDGRTRFQKPTILENNCSTSMFNVFAKNTLLPRKWPSRTLQLESAHLALLPLVVEILSPMSPADGV